MLVIRKRYFILSVYYDKILKKLMVDKSNVFLFYI